MLKSKKLNAAINRAGVIFSGDDYR